MQFSSRTRLIAIIVVTLFIAACVLKTIERERARHLADPATWPRPIQAITKISPDIISSIKVYDLQERFMDETKLVSISGRPEDIEKIISEFGLVKTNATHLLAKHLLESLPRVWNKPQPSCLWYISPGFGTVHQEGVDLFLIAYEPTRGDAVILYYWIF